MQLSYCHRGFQTLTEPFLNRISLIIEHGTVTILSTVQTDEDFITYLKVTVEFRIE